MKTIEGGCLPLQRSEVLFGHNSSGNNGGALWLDEFTKTFNDNSVVTSVPQEVVELLL